MRFVVAVALVVFAGCGKEIGDACVLSSDCDPNGLRYCDSSQREGYCTIQGCDYNTCPEDSACIRFFTGGFENRPCVPATEDKMDVTDIDEDKDFEEILSDDCSIDELCSLEGLCVPRNSESRFCMATCGDDSDCRDGYECRDLELMIEHGGEPVVSPGTEIEDSNVKFCASEPVI
jgi:hypothetical protein